MQNQFSGSKIKNTIMKYKGSIFFSTLIAAVFFIGAYYPPEFNAEKEAILIQRMLSGLNQLHYQPQSINDGFSEKVYNLYLDRVDSGKRWFTQADIDQLKVYKIQLDDEANEGTYQFFNKSVEMLNQSIKKTQTYYRDVLANPLDFKGAEQFELDGEKKEFAKDDAELKEYWRKALKYDVMTKLASKLKAKADGDEKYVDKTQEELEVDARKDVLKNFDDLYQRLYKLNRTDRLSDYLNAITSVYDPHTVYFEPKDKATFDIRMSGTLEGIGAQLQEDGDYTKVVRIIPGGPAWKQAELKANDLIVKVAQDGEDALDVTGMRLDDVVTKIRGNKGTKVILTVKKVDGSTVEIPIIRDIVVLEESYAKSVILDLPGKVENIGYIKLPQFYADFNRRGGRSCAEDIEKELEKLKDKNVNGIILDLRNNGGGSLRDVQRMSGFFIEEGPIVQVKSRGQKPEILEDNDPRVQYKGPLIVMVNSFSASASEILAAALQDYGRAIIVGSNSTFGKGTVQRFIDLDRGLRGIADIKPLGEVKLTIQKFYRVNGGSTQLKGVVPDIILPDRYHYFEVGEKENEYALGWTEIDPVEYSQSVTSLDNLGAIKAASVERVSKDETFQKILQNAKRLKEQSNETSYDLNLEHYRKERAAREAANEAFKDLFKQIDGLKVSNLEVDMENIKADESKEATNTEWIESIQKDHYINETLAIMKDMLQK